MGFLDKVRAIFSGGGGSSGDQYSYYYYVRCRRCGEVIKGRADMRNELSSEYGEGEGAEGYHYRKVLIGRGRCFQQIEVTISFDARRNPVSREANGGEFVTEAEYQAAQRTPAQ